MTNSTALSPHRPIRHTRPGSSFLRMTGGVSIVRYWGPSSVIPSVHFSPVEVAATDEPVTRERVARANQPLSRSVESASA
jgi:hypothetical protein